MKKTLYLLAILAITAFPSMTFASFDTSLKYGSRGDAVSELQDFLTDQNVYTGKIDGKFGLGTVKAVKAFQTANNLSADGYFGKGSRAVATTLLAIDLKTSDDAEIAETGTVSPAATIMTGCTSTVGFSVITGKKCDGTFTPSQVTDTGTQNAINSLTQQVQTLTQQLQTQQPVVIQPATPIVQQDSYQLEAKVVSSTGKDSDGKFEYATDNTLYFYKDSNTGYNQQSAAIAVDILDNGIPVVLTNNYIMTTTSTIPNFKDSSMVISSNQTATEKYIDNGMQKTRTYTQITGLPNGNDGTTAPLGNFIITFSIPALNISASVPIVVKNN